MPLNQGDRDEIQEMINGGMRALAVANPATAKCRPDYPHEGKLRFNRGNPSYYVCECGAKFIKDGKGGLRDA